MRGEVDPRSATFSYLLPDAREPAEHPLRAINAYADAALKVLSREFDELYRSTGPPSIPPEQLLKAQPLTALYSVRSDRAFCEQLDYNPLFRSFLDMSLDEEGLDQSNSSRQRSRLVETDVVLRFFEQVLRLARSHKRLSTELFTVYSTLIESGQGSGASGSKDGTPPKDGGDGTGMVDSKGEKRTNQPHESTTDPEAKLMRRANGRPAKLCFGGHALMENRSGLCTDMAITDSRTAEPVVAEALLKKLRRKGIKPTTVGGDTGYHTKAFVKALRRMKIRPHIARIENRRTDGLDARTTRHESYRVSQRKRKRIEEIFGWLKTVGGLRKSRFVDIKRTQLYAYLAASAYNLLRIAKLTAQPVPG